MKKWYLSKTLWMNLFAAVALFVQNQFGYILPPEVQGYALVLVNLALRLVTKESLGI